MSTSFTMFSNFVHFSLPKYFAPFLPFNFNSLSRSLFTQKLVTLHSFLFTLLRIISHSLNWLSGISINCATNQHIHNSVRQIHNIRYISRLVVWEIIPLLQEMFIRSHVSPPQFGDLFFMSIPPPKKLPFEEGFKMVSAIHVITTMKETNRMTPNSKKHAWIMSHLTQVGKCYAITLLSSNLNYHIYHTNIHFMILLTLSDLLVYKIPSASSSFLHEEVKTHK